MNLPPPEAELTVAQAEGLLDRLLTQAGHGLITDEELRSLLPRLRWRGPEGGRYTLGVNSRTWFAWDGAGWVPGLPPPTLRIDLDPEPEPDVDPMTPLETSLIHRYSFDGTGVAVRDSKLRSRLEGTKWL